MTGEIGTLDTNAVIERFGVSARSSLAVKHNGTGYFAVTPITPYDCDLTTVEQARQMFEKADKRLREIGSGRDRMLFVAILLRDIGEVAVFNAEWDEWLKDVTSPARACFEAKLASPALKVEMLIICSSEST